MDESFLKDIEENIHRLQVCQWAYEWSNEQLFYEIRKMTIEKEWQKYFKQKKDEEEALQGLVFEIKKQQEFNINILKEEKNRTYGNKYIKRKFRHC